MFKIAKQVWVINYDHELISNRPGIPGTWNPGTGIGNFELSRSRSRSRSSHIFHPGPGPGPGQMLIYNPGPG